ncbi:glycoside hydrolase family 47 protein [Cylindrobasidium torrendii FP15055 ss-10]|uniref:alpha-1,2-Mannosidase n=1 Tax=Cylindrobasidium torrendii FP15055 ss-10 TaxID=1314674 RepID=A0A0D7BQD9_9AGAR|nr:glycoside hydrolase family 47 protein [Cylindrobasidium torrendii FP15055 ss-10]
MSHLLSTSRTCKPYTIIFRARYALLVILVVVTFLWFSLPVQPSATTPAILATPNQQDLWPPRPIQPGSNDQQSDKYRAYRIREAFVHTYNHYLERAFPNDELRPVSGRNASTLNGWGVTMYDSLDTAHLMHLDAYIDHAANYLAEEPSVFHLAPAKYAPFFETVIRYLGGLLGVYALTEHTIFLEKADKLGRLLLPVFDTTSGLPAYSVNTVSGDTQGGWSPDALLAESASCQVEYKYLAHLTGRADYFHAVDRVMGVLEAANTDAHPDTEDPEDAPKTGLIRHMQSKGAFPTVWDIETGKPKTLAFSAGGLADSAHEYFLKQYLLSAKSEPRTLSLYLNAVDAILDKLTFYSPKRDFIYVTDLKTSGQPSHTFEHLTCFVGGMLKLGAERLKLPVEKKQLHNWAAEGLAETCWMMYADMPTGLSPNEILVNKDDVRPWLEVLAKSASNGSTTIPGLSRCEPQQFPQRRGYKVKDGKNLLRPEALETWYIMWKFGGGDIWKERAWATFMALEKHAKTKYGFASLKSVDVRSSADVRHRDELPSYFLAETLKYPYLMFDDSNNISLDQWIFNTEAHPLPIFSWNATEKESYGIPL